MKNEFEGEQVAKTSQWPGVLIGHLSPELNEEKAAHRFTGVFLAPQEAVIAALSERRTWIEPRELLLLKEEYGLSMNV
jgi:hypothetical protein